MMVKAAPRLATILCLSYVRPNTACPLEETVPLVGELGYMLAGGQPLQHTTAGQKPTLAMPIGDADSAMVRWCGDLVVVYVCIRGVKGLQGRVSGHASLAVWVNTCRYA